jgi:hypothetical protein
VYCHYSGYALLQELGPGGFEHRFPGRGQDVVTAWLLFCEVRGEGGIEAKYKVDRNEEGRKRVEVQRVEKGIEEEGGREEKERNGGKKKERVEDCAKVGRKEEKGGRETKQKGRGIVGRR